MGLAAIFMSVFVWETPITDPNHFLLSTDTQNEEGLL